MILRTTLEQVRSNPLIRRLFVQGEIRRIDEQLNGTNYHNATDTGDGNNTGMHPCSVKTSNRETALY
jgi:hypothetical protein